MKKKLALILSLIIIIILILFTLEKKLNINKILTNVENKTGINIELQNNNKWNFYPKIIYQNTISFNNKDNSLKTENGYLRIIKNYNIFSPVIINFKAPSIQYEGINFRNSKIKLEYNNKRIKLNNFNADVIDGKINISGFFSLDNKKNLFLSGKYYNISLNRILKQLKLADWERVQIKISSTGFSLNSISNTQEVLKNLNGEMMINGSIFFVSTEEERFGVAFLSLLADRISNMLSLSNSVNYIIDNFADNTSNISGKIFIKEGILKTEKLLISNLKSRALLSATLDLNTSIINGEIEMYEKNNILLSAKLQGDIKNPEILIGGEIFAKERGENTQNLQDIFEGGIQTLIDNILNMDD